MKSNKQCCNCDGRFTYLDTVNENILIDDNNKAWHIKCYEGHQNVLKYLRGEYPLEWYSDDTNDKEDLPKATTRSRKGYNRKYYECPKQQLVFDTIKEMLAERVEVTWGDVRTRLSLGSDETPLLKKLVGKQLIIVTHRSKRWQDAVITLL